MIARTSERLMITASALLLAAAASAGAQPAGPRYDPAWHGGVAAGAATVSVVLLLTEPDIVLPCRWCGVDSDGQPRINRIDDWARRSWVWGHQRRARVLSHLTLGAAMAWPLAGLTAVHGGSGGEWGRDQLAALDSMVVTQAAADVAKRVFRRSRPPVVFDRQAAATRDDVHSFISGHSASAFAAVVSTGVIATRRNSPDAPWIWAGGLGLAASTAYLRIAGDRHYLTDVLGGAAVGTGIALLLTNVFDKGRTTVPEVLVAPPPLAGLGPPARIGIGSAAATVRVAAGPRSLGVVGSLRLP